MNEENYILAKWLANELSPEELKAFESSEDFELYKNIRDKFEQAKTSTFDQKKMLENILSSKQPIIKQPIIKEPIIKSIPLHQKAWFKVAAIITLFFGILISFVVFNNYNSVTKTSLKDNIAFNLPDNSKVVLRNNSTAAYKKNFDNRIVELTTGEAYFEVKKGSKFIVKTKFGNVEVLGTRFNVKTSPNRIDVECYEGKVKISKEDFNYVIIKGQKLFYQKINDDLYKSEELHINQPTWYKNNLSFTNESLENVISEIEKHFAVEIILKIKNNKKFNGTLPIDNLDNALEILSTTYQFNFLIKDETTVIIK